MGIDRDFLPTILVMSKEGLHLLFQILREGLNSFYSHYWSGLPFFFTVLGKPVQGAMSYGQWHKKFKSNILNVVIFIFMPQQEYI